jgi:hypothetical protein
VTRRGVALLLALATGHCAARPRPPSVVTGPSPAARALAAEEELPPAAVASLDALLAEARRGGPSLGVALARGAGALAITGDPAPDDRVTEAAVVDRVGRSAAALVSTACGNVWVVGLHFGDGGWTPRAPLAVYAEARPGQCRTTRAAGAARAMLTESPREVVVTFVSESEDGADARDPALRLFHLAPDGAVTALGAEVALGGTDDRSGAIRDGQWVIDEALLAPRDLYVQIQPGRVGVGGAAPPVVIRRTYRVREGRLDLVEETSFPYRPVGPNEGAHDGGIVSPGLL